MAIIIYAVNGGITIPAKTMADICQLSQVLTTTNMFRLSAKFGDVTHNHDTQIAAVTCH
jgi:hypothetical protein